MTTRNNARFVPVLTVMVDYGNAPFLWLVDRPKDKSIGGNLCDGTRWDETLPMSEPLWQMFADWAIEFDRTEFYLDSYDADDWDWPAFHARGLELSRRLKAEVGNRYRVVYDKPCEDPNCMLDERRESLADGSLVALPPLRGSLALPPRFCEHIVSGGQTGIDRAALDFAIEHGYTHGGWAPQGRRAEDGTIALKYQLVELPEAGYRQRTRRNVEDSDGTLILNVDDIEGGTLVTQRIAERAGKPCLVVQLDNGVTAQATTSVLTWLRAYDIKTLNVAGPRESKRPGIYQLAIGLLRALDACLPVPT